MHLIDGRHRLMAARLRGAKTIRARFFDGSDEDAYVESVRTNITHGKPLTIRERELATVRMLEMAPDWSDRAIADACGLSPKTVGSLRSTAAAAAAAPVRIGLDGKRRPVDPGHARLQVADLLSADPDATVDELARAAGTSAGTVRDVRRRVARGADPLPARLRAKTDDQPRVWVPAPRATSCGMDHAFEALPEGRHFAEWFDSLDIDDDDWVSFVQEVPLSRVYEIIDEAHRRSASWRSFAGALQARVNDRNKVRRA